MNTNERFDELVNLSHARMLEAAEIDELASLAEESGRPNPLLPAQAAVIVKTVVMNQQGRMLVLWRSEKTPMPGQVDLPSGGVDFGEDPADGAIREVAEVGIVLPKVQIASVQGFMHGDAYKLLLGFVGKCAIDAVKLSWEHERFAWVHIDEALAIEGWREQHVNILHVLRSFTYR